MSEWQPTRLSPTPIHPQRDVSARKGKAKRYGIFVNMRDGSRVRSKTLKGTYKTVRRAEWAIAGIETVNFMARGLYSVRPLRAREK